MANRLTPDSNPAHTANSAAPHPFPYIGLVKYNADAQKNGRLSVWIPELGGDGNQPSSWIICNYCTPFAGATDINKISGYQSNSQVAQQSYGWVGIPPDLNTEVMVVFVAGQLSRAYWIGCTYQQNMNHMVPGIAVDITTQPGNPIPVAPTVEYNKSNLQGDPYVSARRPVFTPLANGLQTEGLTSDDERGVASTSMRREAPPLVYGYLTPRGNTIHVDDNPSNEFIRIRTRSGTQVMVDETTGFVYINSKNGQSWFEVSDIGIDGFTTQSVSFRAQQDINLRADRNIILDAGSNIFMRASAQITLQAGTNIEVGAANNLVLSSGGTSSVNSAKDLLLDAQGNLRLQSGADTTSLAAGQWLRKGNTIQDNPPSVPGANASNAEGPQGKVILDTTQGFSGGGSGSTIWKSGGGTVNTIVSRMPTHEPWPGHPSSHVPPPPSSNNPVNSAGSYSGGGNSNSSNNPSSLNNSGCSFGSANTKPISTDTYNAIMNASSQTGADPATMLAFADIESSFNPSAGAGTSSAQGLYQITNGTWNSLVNQYGNQYNVPNTAGSINNANYNALMAGALTQQDSTQLQNAGISNPTPGQLYVMHFMGSSGGPALISAAQNNPDGIAASQFPSAASANQNIFYSGGQPLTNAQVYNKLTTLADSKAQAYAGQYGLAAPCQRGNGVAGNSPSSAAPSLNSNSASYQNDVGQVYGNGQCVALVQQLAGVPNTAQWQEGNNIQSLVQSGNAPPAGTPIATFGPNGTYTNSLDGTSHAALFMNTTTDSSGNTNGMTVLEQYAGQPAQLKNYYFNNTSGNVLSNASNYSIINLPTSGT